MRALRRWVESKKAAKGLKSEDVAKKGSKAVQVFQKWVEICRLVRHFAQALRDEAAGEKEGEEGAGIALGEEEDEEEEEEEEEE